MARVRLSARRTGSAAKFARRRTRTSHYLWPRKKNFIAERPLSARDARRGLFFMFAAWRASDE